MSSTAVHQMRPQEAKVKGNIEKRKKVFVFSSKMAKHTKDALDAGIISIIEHLLPLIICMRRPEPILFVVGSLSYPKIVLVL